MELKRTNMIWPALEMQTVLYLDKEGIVAIWEDVKGT